MNKAILMGRLTRDPDIRYTTKNDGSVLVSAKYTLAVDRRFKRDGEQSADFIQCIAFGRLAEFAEKYLRQGIKIVVDGRIQTGSYTNGKGEKVYTTDVVVESCEFAESKAMAAGNGAAQAEQQTTQTKQMKIETDEYGFIKVPDDVKDEGLPFD